MKKCNKDQTENKNIRKINLIKLFVWLMLLGAVVGATFGARTAPAASAVGAETALGTAGALSGVVGQATANALSGEDITGDLDEATEAGYIGGIISGPVGYGVGRGVSALSGSGSSSISVANSQFTKNNFRNNLVKSTGVNPKGYDAHHTLPIKFEKNFAKAGINVHDPKYGQWVQSNYHKQMSYDYNQKWKQFFKQTSSPTKKQILKYNSKISKKSSRR